MTLYETVYECQFRKKVLRKRRCFGCHLRTIRACPQGTTVVWSSYPLLGLSRPRWHLGSSPSYYWLSALFASIYLRFILSLRLLPASRKKSLIEDQRERETTDWRVSSQIRRGTSCERVNRRRSLVKSRSMTYREGHTLRAAN
jgi:hypothetical protein